MEKISTGPNTKKVAIQAVKQAGKILIKEFKTLKRKDVKFKQKHEIITRADLKSEKIILDIFKKNFPDHQIFSEEKGLSASAGASMRRQVGKSRHKSDYLWIVDPLDGTTNFSMKNPLFAISLALTFKGETILGVIWTPYSKELFVAEKGKGSTLNGKKIKVSKRNKISDSFLTYCCGYRDIDIKETMRILYKFKLSSLDTRQLGSAALELGYVAAGRTESIVIPGANPWDVAAGVLIVREAHGKATDFKGKEWNLKSKDMLTSNSKIHASLLKMIKK